MFHLIGWLIYGLVVGILGKLVVGFFFEEKDVLGVLPTIGVGMAGSYIGGFVNFLMTRGEVAFGPSDVVMGVVGAALALTALHFANKRWGN